MKKGLTPTMQTRLIDAIYARLDVASSRSSAEVLLTLFGAVKSSIGGTALLCSSALYCSLVCERMGPWYRRAVFIGDDLAIHGSSCSCPPNGQGIMVAGVPERRQPNRVGSIHKHEYSGYACWSERFLFGPCLSAQWTALVSWWTHNQLGRAA